MGSVQTEVAEDVGNRQMSASTCGVNSSHFEISIIHFPTSEGVSEVSAASSLEQASE